MRTAQRFVSLALVSYCGWSAIEITLSSQGSASITRAPAAPGGATPLLPVDFIENRGQWRTNARFVAVAGGIQAALDARGIALQIASSQPEGLKLVFEGASADVTLTGEEQRAGVYNFFLGNDPAAWRSQVPAYAAVRYGGLYDGIDVRVREGGARIFEYDVLVAPHADLGRVVIRVDGARDLEVTADGTLVIDTAAGTLRQRPPLTWELLPDGAHRPIQSRFRKIDDQRYAFDAAERDVKLPLVVDPGLEWSTFLGGSGPEHIGPAVVGPDGDVFVGGVMRSPDFPGFNDPNFVLGVQDNAFIARLSATGSQLHYATFFGGWHSEVVKRGLAVDAGGSAVIVGQTFSPDFPTTAGAFDRVGLHKDGFVVRLNPTGGLIFSTLLGGFWEDDAVAVAYDPAGNIVVGGTTSSDDFPTTPGAFDTTYNLPNASADGGAHGDMFIARLTPDGGSLTYGTFLGGPQLDYFEDLVVDRNGIVTVVGWVTGNNVQVFVTTPDAFDRTWNGNQDSAIARLKLDGAGSADLKYATLFGGGSADNLWVAALDPVNPELVTFAGRTWSNNYPVTAGVVRPTNPPFSQLFPEVEAGIITRFRFPAAGGGSVVWSTYHHSDRITGLAVNEAGEPIFAGSSSSYEMPTTRGAFEVVADGAGAPAGGFMGRLNATATQYLYQSFFGGTGGISDSFQRSPQVAHVAGNTVIISGETQSNDFPITAFAVDPVSSNAVGGGHSNEGFVTKITLEADNSGDLTAAAPTLVSPAEGATFHSGSIARLEWNPVTDPSGVEAYEFQASVRADFAPGFIIHRGGVATTEVLIPPSVGNSGGLPAAAWFWRVRTADRAGNLSAWSSVGSFTISGSTGQPTVAWVSVFPPSSISSGVTGGTQAIGTIDLNKAAPPGGLVARLTAHHDRPSGKDRTSTLPVPVRVPALVNIAPGALTASFPIETDAVSAMTGFTLVATVNGVGGSGNFNLVPTEGADPAALRILPGLVTGGTPTVGTVTLSRPAPSGGTAVNLSSSHPGAARVPSSIVVPAGARSASFNIITSPVVTETDARITAWNDNGQWAWPLYVRPNNLPTLTGMTVSPATVAGGAASEGTVTFSAPIPLGTWPALQDAIVSFTSSDPEVAAIFQSDEYVPAGSTTHPFRIYSRGVPQTTTVTLSAHFDGVTLSRPLTVNAVTGVSVASLTSNVTTVSGGAGGIITVNLSAPAPAPVLLTLSSNRPDLFQALPQTIVVFTSTTSNSFAFIISKSVSSPTQVTISAAYGASSSSLVLNVNPPATATPAVSGLTLSPATVDAGSGSTGTVTLQGPAPAGGAVVQLFGGSPATLPASVTVPAGATTATFPISTTAVASDTSVVITAQLHLNFSTTLTVRGGGAPPPEATPSAPTLLSPANDATVGQPVTLDWSDVSAAASYQIQIDDASSFSVPLVVDQTTTASQFTAGTLAARRHWWRVRGRNSAGTVGAWSSVRRFTPTTAPATAALAAVSLSPSTVVGGNASQGTVTLSAAAPSGGFAVSLTSANTGAAAVPASVTVTQGATTATFAVTTAAVTASTAVSITASAGSLTRSATLTVTPEPAPASLSSVSITPASVVGGNTSQGTTTLTSAAPAGGLSVGLTSSNTAVATVPSTVTVAQGTTSATFVVTTGAVTASTPVSITATAGGVTRSATVTATPPAQNATLTVSATGRTGERVTSSPAGINVSVGTTQSAPFAAGTAITLTVTNGRDAIWSGACSSNGSKTKTCTFTLNANATVNANVQ